MRHVALNKQAFCLTINTAQCNSSPRNILEEICILNPYALHVSLRKSLPTCAVYTVISGF